MEQLIDGLYDEVRPGKPRAVENERQAQLIQKTLHKKPADGPTHWSVRTIAADEPTPLLQAAGPATPSQRKLQTLDTSVLHRELRDMVGLYLSPPENALVLCLDERSQCQALERAQPMLPMGVGYVEGVTHDYVRHDTIALFAALSVLNRAVIAACKPRRRHHKFLSFLREIDKAVPAELGVHCIMDN